MNVSLCLVAVLVITTLLIGHPTTAILVFITVVMTVVDILGCMYYWGLVIDNVSVIQAVIAIGLCVDYAAHVGHCFMLKNGTNSERVVKCLADVGAAVLNGGVFLAVLLLSLSKSYVFRYAVWGVGRRVCRVSGIGCRVCRVSGAGCRASGVGRRASGVAVNGGAVVKRYAHACMISSTQSAPTPTPTHTQSLRSHAHTLPTSPTSPPVCSSSSSSSLLSSAWPTA